MCITHKHNFFCPVGLGTTPGLARGFHRFCPWDKFGENLGHTRAFSLFYTVEARQTRVCHRDKPGLVPGTNPGPKGGTESLCEKSLCAFFARYYRRSHALFVEISCELSTGTQGVSETFRSVFTAVVVFCCHRSELL